jgi:hypothetical protein
MTAYCIAPCMIKRRSAALEAVLALAQNLNRFQR